MVIPSIAGAVLSNQAVAAWLPFLYLPGRIISMVTLCAYGYILLKLSSESSRYRMAAICCLASVAVDAGSSLVPEGAAMASLIGLLSFPVMILAFYGEYSEYMGHSEVICALDEEMAVKWKRLWKWFVYSFGLMISSVLPGDVKRDAGNYGAFGRYHRNTDRKRYEADLPVPHCKNIPGICNGEQQITGEQKRRKRLQNSHENFCYL